MKDNAQTEMELIMNEQQDPVSGNTAPIGAKPSEVRDDIDVRVSEGEFIINAQTVRYFGEDFFNELQNAAAEGFDRIKEGDELPFRDDELDVEEEEMPQGFAEGGVVPEPVGGGYGQYGGTGARFSGFQSKQYINDDTKQKMVVFFFNGRPLSRIPKGFREMGETAVEEQQEAEAAQEVRSPADDRNTVALEEIKASGGDWRSKQPSEYGVKDFLAYAENYKVLDDPFQLDPIEQLVIAALSGPIGLIQKATGKDSIIETFIKKQKAKKASQVNEAVNNILEKGEMDGQPLTSEANNILFSAQFEANNVAAANDPFGQTTGTNIFDQPYYQSSTTTPIQYDLVTQGTGFVNKAIGPKGEPIGSILGSPKGKILGQETKDSLSILDLSKLAPPTGLDTDGDGMADLFPPEEEALDIPQGKYDPRDASMSGGAKKNLLTQKEQPSFDNAVDSGNDTLAAHYVQINKLRNKKESFAEQYDSASEDEKDRLMSADRVDGLSTQDREQAIKKSSSSSNKESFHESLVRKARETKEKNKAAGLGAQTKAGSMAGTKSGFFDR